jgi:hypothetical protein
VGHLQSGDRAVGVVVHHDPDDRNSFLDRGRQHRRVLSEAAVADEGEHDLVRTGQLRAERSRRPNPIVA